MTSEHRPVSAEEAAAIFRRATGCMSGCDERWKRRAETGLSDADLKTALEYEMGHGHGWGGPNTPWAEADATGLRIWATWRGTNSSNSLLFAGKQTEAMARAVYGVRRPDEMGQMVLAL